MRSARLHFLLWPWFTALLVMIPFTAASESKSAPQARPQNEHTPKAIVLPQGILKILKADPDSGSDCAGSPSDYSAWVMNLDGSVPEIVVQGRGTCLCSATGNCAFWIFKKTTSGFKTVLATDLVQDFNFKNTRTNGYRDLVTSAHGSISDSELRVFRFDGTRYRLKKCYDKRYMYPMKYPKITPEPCPQL